MFVRQTVERALRDQHPAGGVGHTQLGHVFHLGEPLQDQRSHRGGVHRIHHSRLQRQQDVGHRKRMRADAELPVGLLNQRIALPHPGLLRPQAGYGGHRLLGKEMNPSHRNPAEQDVTFLLEAGGEIIPHFFIDDFNLPVVAEQKRQIQNAHFRQDFSEAHAGKSRRMNLADAHFADDVDLVSRNAAGIKLEPHLTFGHALQFFFQRAHRFHPRGSFGSQGGKLDAGFGGRQRVRRLGENQHQREQQGG